MTGLMGTEEYMSRLGRWLQRNEDLQIHECVCSWTDLLGFGAIFRDSWSPTKEQWSHAIDRVNRAYMQFCDNLSPTNELTLALNDGIVRVKCPNENDALNEIALWLCDLVKAHYKVNKSESKTNSPGARTIITAGQKVVYSSIEEVKQDDLVLDYTRTRPGLSIFAERAGNKTVVLNPGMLQMNVAFSKAYLLDEAGSRQGIWGPSMFFDESFFQYAKRLIQASDSYSLVEENQNGSWLFAAAHKDNRPERPWLFGIRCESQRIPVAIRDLKTTVRRATAFYPWDENPAEFQFEL